MATRPVAADASPMATRDPSHEMYEAACDLIEAARAIEKAAGGEEVSLAVPATLGALEEALQTMSASCYRLAGQCAPKVGTRRPRAVPGIPFSRESEAHLMATLHEVGSGIARASRACRKGRETAAPLLANKQRWENEVQARSGEPLLASA
jgi:hypothetical protein